MQIGLALSGGGLRATVFHLGVLARLAVEHQLEQLTLISSVSGGSLCIGLVYASNQFRFPTSHELITRVIPHARALLTIKDLQTSLIWRVFRSPLSFFETRADDLAALLREHWGLTAQLCDLPAQPRWLINTTCFETGKNWRFERDWLGDYVFGYTRETNVPLSEAVAASAGFPGLIGALRFETGSRKWFNFQNATSATLTTLDTANTQVITPTVPVFPAVHLWDGGVYDNLGLEGLMDPVTGWRKQVEFLIASDASGKAKIEAYKPGTRALHRIISGVMLNQIRILRSRMVIERLVNHRDPGVFLQIGNTLAHVLHSAGKNGVDAATSARYLSQTDATRAADFETTIRKLKPEEFELLFRHGFEVADYTLAAYHPDQFKLLGYAPADWR